MTLWTWHEPEFSLTSGRVDLSRSDYYASVPGIPGAYAELARRVGTDQIIWCYVRSGEETSLPHMTRVEWALDVPDDQVLAVIDTFVWERLIGSTACPPALREKWLHEATQSEDGLHAYIDAREKEYLGQPSPEGGWWSALFINGIDAEAATALIRHPIPDAWILRRGTNGA